MACGTWVRCLEGGGVFPAGGQGDGKDTGRYTQGFKGQTGSGQRDPGWAGEGERSAAFQWRRQEATGSWAARRLVRPECAALEGDRWEMKLGLGCGLQKVLNARLALQLHPGRPETSFVRCTPASAFPRRADATTPTYAFSQPRRQRRLARMWGKCPSSISCACGQARAGLHTRHTAVGGKYGSCLQRAYDKAKGQNNHPSQPQSSTEVLCRSP